MYAEIKQYVPGRPDAPLELFEEAARWYIKQIDPKIDADEIYRHPPAEGFAIWRNTPLWKIVAEDLRRQFFMNKALKAFGPEREGSTWSSL